MAGTAPATSGTSCPTAVGSRTRTSGPAPTSRSAVGAEGCGGCGGPALIVSRAISRPASGSEIPMGKKVTVVGAGFYGSTTAQRLAEYDVFETVVLTDIIEGKPEGLALDMNQSRPIEGFETKVVGQTTGRAGEGYEVVEGSDVVVANPLDEMTALTQLATGFPRQRVLGQAGVLDTARFTNFVAEELDVKVASVKTLTLGSHGDTMVPVPSRCTVDGKPLSELMSAEKIEELVDRTRKGGAEIVALLKTGSAYYAPSAAAARMAKAVAEDSGQVIPVCAWVDGEYGISGVYLGVEAEIGAGGVRQVVETDLTDSELAGLREAAEAVRAKQADIQG